MGIVAHQRREGAARALRRETGAVVMNVDDGTLGCEGNHLVVLDGLSRRHVDWCVVLEDDAVPVGDFRFHVKQALACAPAPIVGLYLGYGHPSGETQRQSGAAARLAKAENRAWIIGDALIGSVGYAVRIRLIAPMLSVISQRGEELPLRISRWAQASDIPVCYTAPSLVDHADVDPVNGPALTAHERASGGNRRAWFWGTRAGWVTPVVPLGYCPGWSAAQ